MRSSAGVGPDTCIGAALSDPTGGDPASPGPSGTPSVADLAHLVVDSAAERELAAESTPEVLLPEDMLPGAGEEHVTLREGLRLREPGLHRPRDHRHTRQPAELRTGRPGAQHPVVVPRLHRSDHIRGGHRRRFPRPGYLADGVAGRPVPACAHHRVGHLRVRPHGVRLRIGDQYLRVLPGSFRRWHLPSQYQQRPRLPAGRYLPDQRAWPALRGDGDGHRRRNGPQPGSGGTHRRRCGWPERVALGLLRPGHPDPGGGGLRLPDP